MTNIKELIKGPIIENGDLISLEFGESNLTFCLPIVPKSSDHFDDVNSTRDFIKTNTNKWDSIVNNSRLLEFSKQKWKYELNSNFDDIARCILSISILEVDESRQTSACLLKPARFRSEMIADLALDFEHHREYFEQDSSWPFLDNNFYTRYLEKPFLPWIFSYVGCLEESGHRPLVHIPLGRRFAFCVTIDICLLHYPDRKNPFSTEQIKQFELEIFDDFLNQISITYSAETLALIKELNAVDDLVMQV